MSCKEYEIKAERILAPSSIPLGEYVINPYRGCSLGCQFCYAQQNKAIQKRHAAWGSFVDIKINAPDLLAEEIRNNKPRSVLIGSTTEVYQPCEKRYELMRAILKLLNQQGIAYTILTRSSLITRDIDLLTENKAATIYFTVCSYADKVRTSLEPHSLPLKARLDVIEQLNKHSIKTYAYINPFIPYISEYEKLIAQCAQWSPLIDIEGLNIQMVNWEVLSQKLREAGVEQTGELGALVNDQNAWDNYWKYIELDMMRCKQKYAVDLRIFTHPHKGYFGVLDY